MGTASWLPIYPTIPHIASTPGCQRCHRHLLFDGFALRRREPVLPVFLFPLEELVFAGMPPSATRARRFAAHPGRVTCVTREMTSESGGTFRVTVVPAAITEPAPTVTGATNCVSPPINTPSPMMVSAFRTPS